MKIRYILSDYNSHNRTGNDYCELIRQHHSLVADEHSADVVILHLEPHNFGAIYKQCPILKTKYVIAVSVWETDDLPISYRRSIAFVQEVWTPSRYCQAVFARYHPRVFYMPYVIDRQLDYSEQDAEFVRNLIQYSPDNTYYLTITKLWDRRKNAELLLNAFHNLETRMPNARLIVKGADRDTPPILSDARTIVFCSQLTWPHITALYEHTDVYVSAHHSEGWGMTMADALLLNKPVIATGYSGNLEFMNENNSFLIQYTEETIHPEDVFGPFRSTMKWAYPKQAHLEELLLFLYELRSNPAIHETVKEKVKAASFDVAKFKPAAVQELLNTRLHEIFQTLA
jgi:glycosyltransferase involved in cell wall biosynthesis